MKYNYPIKYAVIPMKRHVAYDKCSCVVAYIAAKCYLISTTQKYKENGKICIEHEVVFPYELDDFHNCYKRIVPSYNIYGPCTNSIVVDYIFDTFEEAYIAAQMKNKEIGYDEFKDEYSKLEKLVEENTGDLTTSKKEYNESTIMIYKAIGETKTNWSLYDIIYDYSYENFLAFHVSNEKLEQIKEELQRGQRKTILEKNQENLLLSHDGNSKITQIYDYENKSNTKGCYILDYQNYHQLYYDENATQTISNPEFHIYTTETYEDVIKSYIHKLNVDEITVNGKTFAKRIKLK